MMRKIFGGTMVLSIVGAVILGGVLAFVSSHVTKENFFTVGDATWSVSYQAQAAVLGPAGQEARVGTGGIVNDVASTAAIAVDPTASSVHMIGVTGAEGGNGTCSPTDFTGTVSVVGLNPVLPGDGLSLAALSDPSTLNYGDGDIPAGLFDVDVTNNDTAGVCYGATVGYNVIIGVTITGAAGPDGSFGAGQAEPPAPTTNELQQCQAWAGNVLDTGVTAALQPQFSGTGAATVFSNYACVVTSSTNPSYTVGTILSDAVPALVP